MDILDDLIFPDEIIATAARGKRRRMTDMVTTEDGGTKTNAVWDRPFRSYDLGLVARPADQWETIATIHDICNGRARGFLLRDPIDSRVSTAEGKLAPRDDDGVAVGTAGLGYGVERYRLVKRKTYAGYNADVEVPKPESGTVALLRGGSPVTLGAGAGNAAIDHATGYVTFVADASSAVSSVTVGATTVVVLGAAIGGLGVGDRLWLQGLTGADAALLNGQSHPITVAAGASYTMGTNTAGKAITAAGTGKAFPQADETLTWSGRFFVPVAFESDDLDWQAVAGHADEDRRLIQGSSVPLLEVKIE